MAESNTMLWISYGIMVSTKRISYGKSMFECYWWWYYGENIWWYYSENKKEYHKTNYVLNIIYDNIIITSLS